MVPGTLLRGVTGRAERAPADPPPTVGECPTRAVDTTDRVLIDLAGGGAALMAAAAFGPCADVRFGEVTAVHLPNVPGGGETAREHLAAVDGCQVADLAYLGIPAVPAVSTAAGPPVQWQPSVGFANDAVGPSPAARAAGASWVACVVGPVDGGAYPGVARAAFGAGRLPWDTRTCTDDAAAVTATAPCTGPHLFQLLGTSIVNPDAGVTDAELTGGCTALARLLMATSDPTAGGRLTLRVSKDPATLAYLSCWVGAAGGRRLTDSVIALGAAPPPLSG